MVSAASANLHHGFNIMSSGALVKAWKGGDFFNGKGERAAYLLNAAAEGLL